jgi:cytochrome c553
MARLAIGDDQRQAKAGTGSGRNKVSSNPDGRAARAASAMILVAGAAAADQHPTLAADPAYGAYLAAECASCHSVERANDTIPPLRSVPYDSFVAALKEYRDGVRTNAAMQAVARSLGDVEIEALAAHFAGRS